MPTRRQLDTRPSNGAPPDLLTVAETAAVLRCGLTFDPFFPVMPGTSAREVEIAKADPYEANPGAPIAE